MSRELSQFIGSAQRSRRGFRDGMASDRPEQGDQCEPAACATRPIRSCGTEDGGAVTEAPSRGRASSLLRNHWLNLGLLLVLIVIVVIAYLVLGSSDSSTASIARTATVSTGNVTASVSGSGNLASSRNSSLS